MKPETRPNRRPTRFQCPRCGSLFVGHCERSSQKDPVQFVCAGCGCKGDRELFQMEDDDGGNQAEG